MGVFSDVISADETVSSTAGGLNASIRRSLESISATLGEPDVAGDTAVVDEVQSLAVYSGTIDGGDFTLEFTLAGGANFTTASIAYDANAATIETAIDVAATAASVSGWTNGDISVAGGPLTTTPVTFTFDGDSVDGGNHESIVFDDAGLTGGGSAGAVSQTTAGQAGRPAWEALQLAGIIGGTIPEQGEDADDITDSGGWRGMPQRLSISAIKALALQAARDDGNDAVYGQILAVLGIDE
jgi:hypothetical protein